MSDRLAGQLFKLAVFFTFQNPPAKDCSRRSLAPYRPSCYYWSSSWWPSFGPITAARAYRRRWPANSIRRTASDRRRLRRLRRRPRPASNFHRAPRSIDRWPPPNPSMTMMMLMIMTSRTPMAVSNCPLRNRPAAPIASGWPASQMSCTTAPIQVPILTQLSNKITAGFFLFQRKFSGSNVNPFYLVHVNQFTDFELRQ